MLFNRSIALLFWVFSAPVVLIAQGFYTIPVRFAETPKPRVPDYNKSSGWAALPWTKDPADEAPKGLVNLQDSAKADVFFIHPTSFIKKPNDSFLWNASVENAAVNAETDNNSIKYQASIFNGSCKIYAPRYRQAHYYAFFTPHADDKAAALELAYADIKLAFEHYLKNWNNNRPIIIAAHSQGTVHAARLLQDFFDSTALKKRLIVAYLAGMPVGKHVFNTLKPCTDSIQTECWCSWRTFRRGHLPHWNEDTNVVVTNPIIWTINDTYASRRLHKGAVLNDFNKIRPNICDAQASTTVLWIKRPKFPGSRLIVNPNYHVGDYNLFYMDVRENVALRIKKHFASNRVSE